MSLNKALVIGNLGRDAELKYTPQGVAVATMSVASNERWKDKAGKLQERTEWHRIVFWNGMAESLTQYLVKGKQVYVEGKLQTRDWTDKDGVKRYTTEIRADVIRLLGGGGGNSGGVPHPADDTSDSSESTGTLPVDDSDIPF
jgi:single-strand DNA-binding protein